MANYLATCYGLMMIPFLAAPGTQAAQAQAGHLANPVFQTLVERGITAPDGQNYRLPKPVMTDALTAQQQTEVLEQLVGDLPLDRFLRDSVVAPHLCQLEELQRDATGAVRKLDVYFVVHAPLDLARNTDLLSRIGDGESNASGRELKPDELKRYDIVLTEGSAESPRRESYAQSEFRLLDRVQLRMTVRSYWSETPQSILAATTVDPRFVSDPELGSVWRSVSREPDGSQVVGESHSYRGAGSYLKVTRLEEPEGSIFVESHTIYVEPQGWFDGTSLLRSKIPAIVQNQVRAARRDILKLIRQRESR